MADGNTNLEYYMEIQDAALGGQKYPGQLPETKAVAREKGHSEIYHEIDDLHAHFPRVGAYEEVPDNMTNHTSEQKGIVDQHIRDGSHNTTKSDDNVYVKDKPVYDNNVREAQIMNSLCENDRKLINIVKAADETVMLDNDIYEGGDVMAVV